MYFGVEIVDFRVRWVGVVGGEGDGVMVARDGCWRL